MTRRILFIMSPKTSPFARTKAGPWQTSGWEPQGAWSEVWMHFGKLGRRNTKYHRPSFYRKFKPWSRRGCDSHHEVRQKRVRIIGGLGIPKGDFSKKEAFSLDWMRCRSGFDTKSRLKIIRRREKTHKTNSPSAKGLEAPDNGTSKKTPKCAAYLISPATMAPKNTTAMS